MKLKEMKDVKKRSMKYHTFLHSIYLLCRRELDYKGRETWRNVRAFLKRLLRKSHLKSEDFNDDYQWISEWLINDKKRFRRH